MALKSRHESNIAWKESLSRRVIIQHLMKVVKKPCWDLTFPAISSNYEDNALNLVRKTLIKTVAFAGQGGMISLEMALEAMLMLADWSESVKGLEAASSSLRHLWWLSSFCRQTDHSAAAAPSCRVTTCAGHEKTLQALGYSDRRPSASDWMLSLSGSLSPFPLCFFDVD